MERSTVSKISYDGRNNAVSFTPPTSIVRSKKTQQCAKIAELREALLDAGYHSLDRQALALGLGRSTSWVILKAGHKSSGLSGSVIKRMLRSPELPPAAKRVVEDYVAQKLAGRFGHSSNQLQRFRTQLDL